jgi:dTDP-4-dehydrorhamnose reductase
MKVLVIGAGGLLGRALLRAWTDDAVIGLNSRQLDIRDATQVQRRVQETQPDQIVLTAAWTQVDACESEAGRAFAVNCEGAVHVALAARASSARLLFLSTDYVFDGNKREPYEVTDARNPINVYGRSKAEAELQLLELLPDCCIVRTSWLFDAGARCFPETILQLAEWQSELPVVDDQRGSPTYAPDLSHAMITLSRRQATGIVHVTNSGDCTWFDLAQLLLRSSGSSSHLRAVSSESMRRPARRPAYSVLSPASQTAHGIVMPPWQNAVERFVAARNQHVVS